MSTESARDTAKGAADSIVVRAGGRQWTVLQSRPVTDHARPRVHPQFNSPVRVAHTRMMEAPESRVGKRWPGGILESIGWGTVLGILLGCVCVVGSHAGLSRLRAENGQVARVTSAASTTTTAVTTRVPRATPAVHASAEFTGPTLTVPAVPLYGLFYCDKADHPADHRWQLWRVAAYSADLLAYKPVLPPGRPAQSVAWKIAPLHWNVLPLRTKTGTTPGTAARVSAWLASAVSALTSLASSLADGEPGRDAWTAYRTARMMTPQSHLLDQTGRGVALRRFASATEAAFVSCGRGHSQVAAQEIATALLTLRQDG